MKVIVTMLTGSVAKHLTDELKEELSLTQCYGLATDGSCDEDDKLLPVLVRHVGKVSRLIETSLPDMPNINSGSTAQQMFDICSEVIESFSLDRENLYHIFI